MTSPAFSASKYFVPELSQKLKHAALGTLSMAIAGEGDKRGCGSQFFFTLAADLEYLDGKHAPFGRVIEGEDTLAKINEAFTDGEGKPLREIRIRHVIVLGSLPRRQHVEGVTKLTSHSLSHRRPFRRPTRPHRRARVASPDREAARVPPRRR